MKVVLLLFASNLVLSHALKQFAFVNHNFPSPPTSTGYSFSIGRKLYAAASDDENESKGTATLNLTGRVTISTKPLPKVAQEELLEFFTKPEHRNLLVTAGGTRPVEMVEVTPDLLNKWKTACDVVGAKHPSNTDNVVSVTTGGLNFPGLKLETTAKIGVTLLQEPEVSVPTYEFTLIGDERTVSGLPPIVWVYNKLTGAGKEGEKETSTKSLSRISYELSEDDKITFTTDSVLTILVKFPAVLLKILPTNKDKAEESGGASIAKLLEKDVKKSMAAFEEAYENFII